MKRSAWLQVHLSTAVVLMFVAGMLLWANMGQPQVVYRVRMNVEPQNPDGDVFIEALGPGWPYPAWEVATNGRTLEEAEANLPGHRVLPDNVLVALAILAAVAVPMEWWTRRRERRKRRAKPSAEDSTENPPAPKD